MSIYPVKISTWFTDQKLDLMECIFSLIVESGDNKCENCKNEVSFDEAYMMHAVPYGYGDLRVWCSKCRED